MRVLLFLPDATSVLDVAKSVELSTVSAPKLMLLEVTSSVESGGRYSFSVVIGAKGLPKRLIGIGAGCIFSPVISSG